LHLTIAIIYNEPVPGHYEALGERTAVLGVLEAVEAVHQALVDSGYSVIRMPLLPPIESVRPRLEPLEADLVFNLFEGFDGWPGSEAAVADILSELGLAFTGCPSASLSLALDKGKAKAVFEAAGIRTPRYQLLKPETLGMFDLRYPCIVKPCAEDASHGISELSIVNDQASLERRVAWVCDAFGGLALVEEYLDGREFNATVLGTDEPLVLPISEIVYNLPVSLPRILCFPAKWEPESVYHRCTAPFCPAQIEPDLREKIADYAIRVFRLLGCSGYGRVDFRLDAAGNPAVLEANPNCDISPTAGAALQARTAGMDYRQFIDTIVHLALEQQPA